MSSATPATPQGPARHEALMEHFDAALELDPAARVAFLARLRAENPRLAAEVESLLFHDASQEAILDRAAPHVTALREALAALPADPREHDASVPAMGLLMAGRYRLEQVLGRGGGGTVCQARDLQTGREVAVKFLRGEGLSKEQRVRRFRREFRAVARLEHPGCVQVFAEGVERGQHFIVMEYIGGGDLDQLVGAPSDLVLAVLVQVAVALDYVHGRRIVHRDLKPANILLAPGDLPVPKLADFGIALLRDDSSVQTEESAIVGTIDYLSPEQVEGRPADPRSDLYALGCIIYRLWTGHPPFAGHTFLRLAARCKQAPPPFRQLAPNAPIGLEQLTVRLLAIDPADRPQSALDVAATLAELLLATGSPRASALLAPTSFHTGGAFLYRAGLVGREIEQGQLIAQARSAAAGAAEAPALVALCGEGGVGKSTLAQAVQRALTAEGFRAFLAAVPAGAAGPLAPFPELRAALDGTKSPPAPPGHDRPASGDGERGLYREAEKVVEQLRAHHATTPLLVHVEDLHYAAQGSFEVLADVARRLAETPGPRPALLVTLRPEARDALTATAARWGASIRWISLDPLDDSGVAAVAAAMLGVRVGQLPQALVDLLMVESDGSPLLAQSALRALVDRGALRRREGRWELEDGQTTGSARDTLMSRLAPLSAPTRRLLEVAAVIGRRFEAELIVAVTGDDEDSVQDAIDEALRASVIRQTRGGIDVFEFEHVRLAEVLHDEMDAEARTSHHAALGRLLDARGAPAATCARHHSLAGDPSAALRSLRAAGEEAMAGYDHSGAERFFREALERAKVLGEGELIGEIQGCREGLADALVMTDQVPEAVRLLDGLLRAGEGHLSPAARAKRGRLLRKLGVARMRSGDTIGAITALESALLALQDPIPRGRIWTFLRMGRDVILGVTLGVAHRFFGLRLAGPGEAPRIEEAAIVHRELGQLFRWVDLERSVAHHIASGRAAERVARPALQVDALSSIAMALAFFSDGVASLALERLVHRLARSSGDRVGVGRLLMLKAGVDLVVRDLRDESLRGLEEGIALMQSSGDRMLYAWALSWRGWAGVYSGNFAGSIVDFTKAHAIAEALHIDWLIADSACGICLLDCVQGRFEVAERVARDLLSSEVRLALPVIEALCTEVLGAAALMKGRFREALAEFLRARQIYFSHHLERGWGYLLEMEETEAMLCLVDRDGPSDVPDYLGRLLQNARSVRSRLGRLPIYQGCALVLFGIHHARGGRPNQARDFFARALALRPLVRETYMDAWMLWRISFELRRLGDSREDVLPLFAKAEQIIESRRIDGLLLWLADTRRLYDL